VQWRGKKPSSGEKAQTGRLERVMRGLCAVERKEAKLGGEGADGWRGGAGPENLVGAAGVRAFI
jgi:hypothetical protein